MERIKLNYFNCKNCKKSKISVIDRLLVFLKLNKDPQIQCLCYPMYNDKNRKIKNTAFGKNVKVKGRFVPSRLIRFYDETDDTCSRFEAKLKK